MPTVVIELGPVDAVVEHTAELADSLARAITLWAEDRAPSGP